MDGSEIRDREFWRGRRAARLRGREARLERHFQRSEIHILVVADGFLAFNDDDTGLADLLAIMARAPARVQFRITTAHRGAPPSDQLAGATPGFRFTDAALAGFDQVWLFAADALGALAADELLAVTRFMQAGKGVFATGDHQDLGAAMCGALPRVRAMRTWHWPGPGPRDEPVAPPAIGAHRHATGAVGEVQQLEPRAYPRRLSRYASEDYPHPLLCGPHGTIRALPAHAHEGGCVVPRDPAAVVVVGPPADRLTLDEFPLDASGRRVLPEIIAHARTTTGAAFGAIAAYDGHRAGVGRVVVGASWHHALDIGAGNSDAPHDLSYLAQLSTYFHNLGCWLAPPARQRNLERWALRYVARSYPLIEELANISHARLELDDYVRIGAAGYRALEAYVRPCAALAVLVDLVAPARRRWPWPIDPWDPPQPGTRDDPGPIAFDARPLELASLGAVFVELARIDDARNPAGLLEAFEQAEATGIRRGAALVHDALAQSAAALSAFVAAIR